MKSIIFTPNSFQGIITAATAAGSGDATTSEDGRSSQFLAEIFTDEARTQTAQVLVMFDVSTVAGTGNAEASS